LENLVDSPLTPIQAASAEAVAAAQQSDQLAVLLTAIQAAQLIQAQQPTPVPAAVQQPVQASGSPAKWIGIGVGGSVFLLTVAVSAVAVGISAVALTVCLLVLRSVWRDARKDA
jgi:hypothetical protein